MRKTGILMLILLAVFCLAGTAAMADGDFSAIAGDWYTDEIMMTVTEEGRFLLGWNDEDWTGTLEEEWRTNEEDEEYPAYRMILDDPELSMADELELIPELYYPGKMGYYQDGSQIMFFYSVPVSVTETDEEELEYYEPYTLIDTAEGEEPAVTMLFTLLRPATDVAVLALHDQEIDGEGNLGFSATVLEAWEELDSQEHIVVTHVFEGDLPELAITFTAEDGTVYELTAEISGADGELILLPMEAGQG